MQTDADGNAYFEIEYLAEALQVGSYVYQVKELDTQIANVTYSTKVYHVTVTVTQDAEGNLVATIACEDAEDGVLTFVNTYAPAESDIPVTGDMTQPAVLIAMMGTSALGMVVLLAALLLNKKRVGARK